MSFNRCHRFELAYSPFFVRKRVGKRFKVICRFQTYEQASEYLGFMIDLYPGIRFDIVYVPLSHLDKESSL